MRPFRTVYASIALLVMICVPALAAPTGAEPTLIQPAELGKILASGKAPGPVLIQVGFHVLYVQAHIPGSIYAGPTSTEKGLRLLRESVEKLPRSKFIVLYCGCCPWVRCPNIHPAWNALKSMGFTNVKVLYIAHNFGKDWVDHGYSVARGE